MNTNGSNDVNEVLQLDPLAANDMVQNLVSELACESNPGNMIIQTAACCLFKLPSHTILHMLHRWSALERISLYIMCTLQTSVDCNN